MPINWRKSPDQECRHWQGRRGRFAVLLTFFRSEDVEKVVRLLTAPNHFFNILAAYAALYETSVI
ncbi:MAG: hypothetical protein EHM23_20275 [Acidobacteria bacterium]|nr:MAG: hypothetical protein EHM23_20275 [Acidobacteriota bacterium]